MISSVVENWMTIDITPLAIISFHLKGMQDTVPKQTYLSLQCWLQGNLAFGDIEFDLGNQTGQNMFSNKLNQLCQELGTKYKRYVYF